MNTNLNSRWFDPTEKEPKFTVPVADALFTRPPGVPKPEGDGRIYPPQ